jgi:hypothetical protein
MRRALVFITIGLLLTGCATMSKVFKGKGKTSVSSKELEVATILKFDDVPVPDGFSFIASESFAFQTQQLRVGLLKYEGRANPDEVVQFYKEQMPLYNWRIVNIIEYEKRLLSFEKNGQSCIVTIEGKGNKVNLIIAVSPRSGKASSEFFEK